MMIFGVLLVVMMLYRPQGFLPSKSRVIVFDAHAELDAEIARRQAGGAAVGAPDRELHDAQSAGLGHVAHGGHYPAALHGPDGADGRAPAHPVLEVGPGAAHASARPHGPATPPAAPAGRTRPAPQWPGAPRFPRFGDPSSGGAPA